MAGRTNTNTTPPAIAIAASAAWVAAALWIVRRAPITCGACATNHPHRTAAPVASVAPRATAYQRAASASTDRAAVARPAITIGSAPPISRCRRAGAVAAAVASVTTLSDATQAPD